jgi:E3 ubiquitin-protein ligase HUWE1
MIPLKENGTSITVTNETKKEFVQLSAQYRLYSSIKDQIEALLNGFYDIIPKDLISIVSVSSDTPRDLLLILLSVQ